MLIGTQVKRRDEIKVVKQTESGDAQVFISTAGTDQVFPQVSAKLKPSRQPYPMLR